MSQSVGGWNERLMSISVYNRTLVVPITTASVERSAESTSHCVVREKEWELLYSYCTQRENNSTQLGLNESRQAVWREYGCFVYYWTLELLSNHNSSVCGEGFVSFFFTQCLVLLNHSTVWLVQECWLSNASLTVVCTPSIWKSVTVTMKSKCVSTKVHHTHMHMHVHGHVHVHGHGHVHSTGWQVQS